MKKREWQSSLPIPIPTPCPSWRLGSFGSRKLRLVSITSVGGTWEEQYDRLVQSLEYILYGTKKQTHSLSCSMSTPTFASYRLFKTSGLQSRITELRIGYRDFANWSRLVTGSGAAEELRKKEAHGRGGDVRVRTRHRE